MPYVHRHVAWVLIMTICIHIIGLVQLFNTLTEQKITTKQLQLAHLIVADTFNVSSPQSVIDELVKVCRAQVLIHVLFS